MSVDSAMRCKAISTATLLWLMVPLRAAPPRQPLPEHGLKFDSPATRWDEALPLGNGMMGALLWGDGRPLRLSLDRADLWDLRAVPEYHSPEYSFSQLRQWKEQGRMDDIRKLYEQPYNRPAPTKIPAGRIEISMPGDAAFRQTSLSLADAEGAVVFAGGRRVGVFVHATEPVGLIRIDGAARAQAKLLPPAFSGTVREGASGGIGAGDLAQLGYPAPRVTAGETWQAYSQEGAQGFRFAVYLAWTTRGGRWEGAWSVASSLEGEDPLGLARARVEKALQRGYDGMAQSHRRWWAGFWNKSSIRVPNRIIERQWYLEQYKFGSAARRGAPPISLQAVWTADDGKLPPWKGDYHHDLNTQLSYWPCYSGNHLEEGLSYLDWLWKTREAGFAWTKQFFQMPGLNVPMTADLNGNQIGGWVQYTHSATTAAWLAHHFYLHWKYSGDRTFLRERAYPYLRDASVFVEAFTAVEDASGKRTHPLSASPEVNDNRPTAWFDSVTNFDLALERWLMAATAELAAEVGKPEEARHWRQVLSEFPEFSLADDGGLLLAAGQPLKASHRHFSHLMAIHPLGLIDWTGGAEAQRTIRASLAHLEQLGPAFWCGYSYAWLGNLEARAHDGAKAERALEIFATAFTLRSSFHANGDQSGKGYSKFTYRPFTLEGNFAEAAGVQEMLLQSHGGLIEVFPAVPDAWRDISFTTLRAMGAFLVSATKADGHVREVEILAEKGGRCRVLSPWTGKEIVLEFRAGEKKTLRG